MNSTQFLLNQTKINMLGYILWLNKWKILLNSIILYKWGGGLNGERGSFQIFTQRGEAYKRGGLIMRGT